jgi:hypothetical protein
VSPKPDIGFVNGKLGMNVSRAVSELNAFLETKQWQSGTEPFTPLSSSDSSSLWHFQID